MTGLTRRCSLDRLALLAILLVLVRVAGWELHVLTAQHAPTETCAACLNADRDDSLLPPAAPGASGLMARLEASAAPAAELRVEPLRHPRSRGPPARHA